MNGYVNILAVLAIVPILVHGSILRGGANDVQGIFDEGDGPGCTVSSFRTQDNFDLDSFMGRWYITSDIGEYIIIIIIVIMIIIINIIIIIYIQGQNDNITLCNIIISAQIFICV